MADKAKDKKPSPVEGIKIESGYLAGHLAEELVDGNAFFGKESIQLIKHHGSYQQDDRDHRADAKKEGVPGGKYFSMMIRTAVPGGRISSEQLLAELDLCDEVGNGTLRVTTRQGLQLHGVLKSDLKSVIRRINEIDLSTLAACGDVRRNVMCTPSPYKNDSVHDELLDLAERIARELAPKTSAYREIWLTDQETGEKEKAASIELTPAGNQTNSGAIGETDPVEPLYGPTYLPRKFKFGVGLPGDNSVDIYTQDCGFLAICEDFQIVGYNVLVGGSFGMTPSASKTFPAIGKPMCFVTPDQAIDVAKAVIKVHRDYGDRTDRKVARLKYVLHEMGMPKFKEKVEGYFGGPLPEPRPVTVFGHDDGLGWHEQGDGKWFYGLNIENGRIQNENGVNLKDALREIGATLAPPMVLTPHQGIIFADIAPDDRDKIPEILHRHGVPLSEEISTVRRWSMSCPALPTCGLAVTESERVLPGIIDALEEEVARLGLSDEVFTTRMTGCPNGCARPYNADIALVGKAKDKYTIYVGGRVLGDRLNFIYRDLIPTEEIVPTLAPVLERFKTDRASGESFGDYCWRHREELELGE